MKENRVVLFALLFAGAVLGMTYFFYYKDTEPVVKEEAQQGAKRAIDTYVVKVQNSEIEELAGKSYRAKVNDTKFMEFIPGREGLVEKVHVNIGDKVKAGQALITVYHPQSQEAAASFAIDARKAEIDARIADDRADKIEDSAEEYRKKVNKTVRNSQTSVSTSTTLEIIRNKNQDDISVEDSKLDAKDLKLQAELYQRMANSGMGSFLRTTYTAPFDGVVSELLKVKGSIVSADEVLVSVLGENGKKTAMVQLDKSTNIQIGEKLFIYDPNKPFQKWEGMVKAMSPTVNNRGLKLLQLDIPQDTDLRANQNVRVRAKENPYLEVPLAAILNSDNKTFVWKVKDNVMNKVPVVLGEIINNNVLVEEGLSEGDIIAARSRESYVENQSVEAEVTEKPMTTNSEDGHAHEH